MQKMTFGRKDKQEQGPPSTTTHHAYRHPARSLRLHRERQARARMDHGALPDHRGQRQRLRNDRTIGRANTTSPLHSRPAQTHRPRELGTMKIVNMLPALNEAQINHLDAFASSAYSSHARPIHPHLDLHRRFFAAIAAHQAHRVSRPNALLASGSKAATTTSSSAMAAPPAPEMRVEFRGLRRCGRAQRLLRHPPRPYHLPHQTLAR